MHHIEALYYRRFYDKIYIPSYTEGYWRRLRIDNHSDNYKQGRMWFGAGSLWFTSIQVDFQIMAKG